MQCVENGNSETVVYHRTLLQADEPYILAWLRVILTGTTHVQLVKPLKLC